MPRNKYTYTPPPTVGTKRRARLAPLSHHHHHHHHHPPLESSSRGTSSHFLLLSLSFKIFGDRVLSRVSFSQGIIFRGLSDIKPSPQRCWLDGLTMRFLIISLVSRMLPVDPFYTSNVKFSNRSSRFSTIDLRTTKARSRGGNSFDEVERIGIFYARNVMEFRNYHGSDGRKLLSSGGAEACFKIIHGVIM